MFAPKQYLSSFGGELQARIRTLKRHVCQIQNDFRVIGILPPPLNLCNARKKEMTPITSASFGIELQIYPVFAWITHTLPGRCDTFAQEGEFLRNVLHQSTLIGNFQGRLSVAAVVISSTAWKCWEVHECGCAIGSCHAMMIRAGGHDKWLDFVLGAVKFRNHQRFEINWVWPDQPQRPSNQCHRRFKSSSRCCFESY